MANNTKNTYRLKERLVNLTPSERLILQEKLKKLKLKSTKFERKAASDESIAIIGMAFYFPGEAKNVASFWEILSSMRDTIGVAPTERESKLAWQGGYLKDIDRFDAAFFNISPREAELMDPQQRLLMETVWHAIEDAGYDPLGLAGSKTGLFVGLSTHDYRELILAARIEEAYSAIGTSPALISNRISYWFDFRGASETLDTACSSSLVALHQAVLSLKMGHCDQALVGAANLLLSPNLFIAFEKAGMLSPDERCKVFDKDANGYVRGEGIAALLLKPLSKAEAAGDRIYGVILGSAVNHGGRANSLTAPNPVAQKELLIEAYRAAGISPVTVSYVEAHGTGTSLGDPIEVEALQEAFQYLINEDTEKLTIPYCGLGSVKANLGHLEAAAGIAGIIKVLLMLQYKQLPGQLHFQELNPYIRLENSPFYVVSETKPWESEGSRRAGINSFGFGGANAHVVLEEGPTYNLSTEQHKPYYLVTLSAKHPDSLKQRVKDLSIYLKQKAALPIEAITYTLNARRSHFNHRLAMVVGSSKELQEKFEQIQHNQKVKGCFAGQVTQEPEDSAIYKQVLKSSLEKLKNLDIQEATEYRDLLEALANLYVKGYELDWSLLHQSEDQQTIALPTYPFLKEQYWVPEAAHKNNVAVSQPMLSPVLRANITVEDQSFETVSTEREPMGVYYYEPSWQSSKIKPVEKTPSLLVINHDDLAAELKSQIKLTSVKFAENYAEEKGRYEINKANLADYRALFTALKTIKFPDCIVYRNQASPEELCQDLLCFSKALMDQKEMVKVLFINEGENRVLLTSAISAFAKVLQLEHPHIQCRVIEIENISGDILRQELGQKEREVRYVGSQRRFKVYQETVKVSSNFTPKLRGTYLITGGAGGLGLIFAEYLVKHYQARLILTGRSELPEIKKSRIAELGPEAFYIQADIANKTGVERLLQETRAKVGPLTGILHSAGVLSNALITKKDPQSLKQVLAPKISGTLYLDELTQEDPLEYFVLFSSVASVFADAGQCDYAYANGFMDGFACYRENLRKLGLRQGRTLAINWPIWLGGGMQETLTRQLQGTGQDLLFIAQLMEKNLGLLPLEQKEGLKAFLAALNSASPQVMVLPGKKKKLEESLQRVTWLNSKVKIIPLKPALLIQEVIFTLKRMVGKILKIAPEKLEESQNLSEYGMDSINLGTLAVKLNDCYQLNLTPAIFYAQPTIRDLSTYLVTEFGEHLSVRHSVSASPLIQAESVQTVKESAQKIVKPTVEIENREYSPIAIVGMHGLFPRSENLEVFWEHLSAKDDLITEIPANRWDWREYYDSREVLGKSNSKWGGFIDGIDQFDAAFFNISPHEAELMDPQHRLFLETVWKMFEEAGYNPYALPTQAIGVFVGVQFNEYRELLKGNLDAYTATGNSHAMLANRVSYLFNLQGPSEAIDTACSSSLIAIHRAVSALHNQECRLAVAGGVSLALSPNTYVMTSQMGVLSSDGRCKTFDKAANGYVKGEGVGAILLKPLAQAKLDGDKIHGIIMGSAVNHGGKAQSLTAPNPNAQSEVLKAAYKVANVHPSTISYIEVHGTGTVLGDPIEIDGLKKAFSGVESKKTCGIGCVKTNIGHLEPAAGIAGVIKVLLSMQHAKLPGNVNFKELNPYIELKNTPFYILDKTQDWEQPIDEQGNILPRRAGVSSFGFGGANAHVILEEGPEYILSQDQHKPYYLVTLSAKHPDSLKQRMEDLALYLKQNGMLPIEAIAYTLNVRRGHFNHRLAVVVSSTEELQEKLGQLQANQEVKGWFRGQVSQEPEDNAIYKQVLRSSLEKLKTLDAQQATEYKELLEALANLYVKGYELDWNLLHEGEAHQWTSLPNYPFLKNRYWIIGEPEENPINKRGHADVALPPPCKTSASLLDVALSLLKDLFAKETKVPLDDITVTGGFEVFGINSILIMQLTRNLEKIFGKLPSTLFYKYKNLEELAGYFLDHHSDVLKNLNSEEQIDQVKTLISEAATSINPSLLSRPEDLRAAFEKNEDIAIIGMNGKYPMARNLEEYWDNLKEGKNCITEIPLERWDYKKYFDPAKGKVGKIYCKWGGFIEDVDKFDPIFFNISPREATIFMDPQERLFLESVWSCLESSNYKQEKLNARVGVFVGASFNNYQLICAEALEQDDVAPILNSQIYSIANRVSYYFNFTGPSLVVDTACSSSLYAVHLACESVKRGECELAIAGGTNLSLHPSKYATLCASGFAAIDGICHSFGEGGDGYVPGEGVGVVLLKPLVLALKDNDEIYGVIKGTAVSQDGKTHNYTVPNPIAQSEAIQRALDQARIDPRTINYVEAHGTGTSLGDPIEITGLNDVYVKYTQDKQYCAIGSVKSNIGHLEAAAGIAGLTKVLLQMKHKMLVPTLLHNRALNPNINFSDSSFYVQQELSEWQPLETWENGQKILLPRRAAISSFGAGGVNVHVVVEEYIPEIENQNQPIEMEGPFIFVLSAKTPEALVEYVKLYIAYLAKEILNLPTFVQWQKLAAICYTLQTCREAMPVKLAFSINNAQELLTKLEGYLNRPEPMAIKKGVELDGIDAKKEQFSQQQPEGNSFPDPQFVMQQWLASYPVVWEFLYPASTPKRLVLPTYPFSKRRCWPEKIVSSEEPSLKASQLVSLPSEKKNNEYYLPSWHLEPLEIPHTLDERQVWCIDLSDSSLGESFKKEYPSIDSRLITPGVTEEFISGGHWKIDIRNPGVWKTCFKKAKKTPGGIILIASNQIEAEIQVLLLFRLMKSLAANDSVWFKIVIPDVEENSSIPHSSALKGLALSIVKEHPKWSLCCLEIPTISQVSQEKLDEAAKAIMEEPPVSEGRVVRWVNGFRAMHTLSPYFVTNLNKAASQITFRKGGVYVIAGGAGGIGYALSEYLIRKYQARLVWIGRRALAEIEAKRKAIAGEIIYYQADITDFHQLQVTIVAVKESYGSIHGVFDSAFVLKDDSFSKMSEETLMSVLMPKVKGSINLYQAFANEPLDFLIFFSSVQSFIGSPGQSNYAAASTFQDAYALSLKKAPFPVKVINWSYWGSVGSVSTEYYRKRMQRQGVESIEPEDGMQAIEFVLQQAVNQISYIKGRSSLLGKLLGEPCMAVNDTIPPINFNLKLPATKQEKTVQVEEGKGIQQLFNLYYQAGILETANTFEDIKKTLEVRPAYERLLREHLELLCVEGLLIKEQGKYKKVKEIKAQILSKENPYGRLLAHCLDHTLEVMQGKKLATEVLFPEGSLDLVAPIYQAPESNIINHKLADLVQQFVVKQENRVIRILEIGAGTGGTSRFVLEALKPYQAKVRYCFTDISQRFVQVAKETYAKDYPFLEFATLNIEQFPKQVGQMDIVIAANVVHATAYINRTLEHSKVLLKQGGLLLLNEITEKIPFLTLIFGLTPGWWLFKDNYRISGSPLLSKNSWEGLLSLQSWQNIHLIQSAGLSIIMAQSNGIVSQEEAKTKSEEPSLKTSQLVSLPSEIKEKSHIKEKTTYRYEEIFNLLLQVLAKILVMQPEELEPNIPLQDYGLDSINGLVFITELSQVFPDNPIIPTDLYRYTTIAKLSEYVYQQQDISDRLLSLPQQPMHLNSQNKDEKKLLDEISQLTDEQVEAFIQAEIEEANEILSCEENKI